MQVQLVGIKKVDYVSKKTNEPVKGIEIHVLETNSRVQGVAAEHYFLSGRLGFDETKLKLQEFYELVFNKYQSVETIQPV